MEDNVNIRIKYRELDEKLRLTTFEEVAKGYDEEEAVREASRCIGCKNAKCTAACPIGMRTPEIMKLVQERKFDEAYEVASDKSNLPSICGRVCPQENQCEGSCIRGIKGDSLAIGKIERFVADRHFEKEGFEKQLKKNGVKVAIIGSGPSGISCAYDLARKGFAVTIFEALHLEGGALVYGIPEFRLPNDIVKREFDNLRSLGVTIKTNMVIGKILTIKELMDDYDFKAVFIGTGAGLPIFLNIPGEDLNGVLTANEYLVRINLMKAYESISETPIHHGRNVVVIGGGNVAMDAARTAIRLGAESVKILYRRSMEEMPARKDEIKHAMEEGVEFKTLLSPVEILSRKDLNMEQEEGSDYQVGGVRLNKMTLSEPDESGRRKPVKIEGEEELIKCDMIILALGTKPNPLLKKQTPELITNDSGKVIVDDKYATSIEGVFAGGDIVTGAATVILAMKAGRIAANKIEDYIASKNKK